MVRNCCVLALGLLVTLLYGCTQDAQSGIGSQRTFTRAEAIEDHWDEIRENLTGSGTVEVCSTERAGCDDLEVNIESGVISRVNFPDGGYLTVSAEIDSEGNASGIDQQGNAWDFRVDLDSSVVQAALKEWAECYAVALRG